MSSYPVRTRRCPAREARGLPPVQPYAGASCCPALSSRGASLTGGRRVRPRSGLCALGALGAAAATPRSCIPTLSVLARVPAPVFPRKRGHRAHSRVPLHGLRVKSARSRSRCCGSLRDTTRPAASTVHPTSV